MKNIYIVGFSLILSLFAVTPALAQDMNRIPIFMSEGVTTATVGEGYIYSIRAYDPDANRLTYALAKAPAGMAIDSETHVIVWTPKAPGSYPVTVSVYDYTNQPALQSFTIVVAPVNVTPSTQASVSQTTSFGLFGGSAKAKALEISNIKVTSGPRNINSSVSNANCGVAISWNTNLPSVGVVMYGDQATAEEALPSSMHSVTLPTCLGADQAYYFTISAFSDSQHVVSPKQTILPLPVQVSDNTVAAGTLASVASNAGSSVLSVIGNLIVSPFTIVLLIAIILFIILRKLWRASNPLPTGHGGGHGEALDEPIIAIPHH